MRRERTKNIVQLARRYNENPPQDRHDLQDSPLPPGADFSPGFMASFEHVFEESLDELLPISSQTERCSPIEDHTAVDIGNQCNQSPAATSATVSTIPSQQCSSPVNRGLAETFLLENKQNSVVSPNPNMNCTAVPTPQCEIFISAPPSIQDTTTTPITQNVDFVESYANIFPSVHSEINNTPMPSPIVDFSENDNNISESSEANENIASSTPSSYSFSPATSELTSNPSSITSSRNDSPPSRKRKATYKTNPGRKRSRLEQKWVDNVRKNLCNSGKAYKSRNGKEREERKIKKPCTCRNKCQLKIPEEERRKIFEHFWNIGNHAKQWDAIGKFVIREEKKRCTTEGSSKRNYTHKYSLPNYSKESTEKNITVCKTMFINTFGISKDFVYTALDKYENKLNTFQCAIDNRGRHDKHKMIITSEVKRSVIDHVNSFVPVESHYIRKDSNKKYLDCSLSYSRMFKMYNEWYSAKEYTDKARTVRQYRDIVNAEMNIAFFVPKKDQCDECHKFKNDNNPTLEVQKLKENHIINKDYARKLKLQDKSEAISNPKTTIAAVFDFEKVLNSPHGDISIYYYKRKLNVYNFTIFSMGSLEALCYMWDEQTAKRGANEVGSCLYDFFKNYADKGVKYFRLWSDNCGGQNRNRIVFAMYLYASQKLQIEITHRFLEKGHTQNEGDSVHALIEKSSTGKEIYTPDEWYALVRWAKITGKPYKVKEVTQKDIYDFKSSQDYMSWTKNENEEKVAWSKIKEIHVKSEKRDSIFYKYNLQDDFYQVIHCGQSKQTKENIEVQRRSQRRQKNQNNSEELNKGKDKVEKKIMSCQKSQKNTKGNKATQKKHKTAKASQNVSTDAAIIEDLTEDAEELDKAYSSPIPIPILKYKDLEYFCKNNIIPAKYHNFYKNLICSKNCTNIAPEED